MHVPHCDLCGSKQKTLGALLFGPPDLSGLVRKSHICVTCYGKIIPRYKDPLDESAAP